MVVILAVMAGVQDLADALEKSAALVLERTLPAVAQLKVERTEASRPSSGPFGQRPEDGLCSAVVIDPGGYLITSWSNVEGTIRSVEARIGKRNYAAEIVGFDAILDVALLKVDASDLFTLPLAQIKDLRVGQRVFVVGRAPGGGPSLNPGILSAVDRFAERMVQTDCRTNYASAGGALVDAEGRLIGIVGKISPRHAESFGQSSGVSFAVRWDRVAEVLHRLKKGVKVRARKAFLGITHEETAEGVKVRRVQAGSPAHRAGLRKDDIIRRIDGVPVDSQKVLIAELMKKEVGQKVQLVVEREGKEVEIQAEMGEKEAGRE